MEQTGPLSRCQLGHAMQCTPEEVVAVITSHFSSFEHAIEARRFSDELACVWL
jgi:hypothetical protein